MNGGQGGVDRPGSVADRPGPPSRRFRRNYGSTVAAPVAPPAISGGTLRILADGQTAVAADPDRDQRLHRRPRRPSRCAATIALNAGDEPGRVVADAAGRAHVALRRGGALVSIDTVAGDAAPAPRRLRRARAALAYDAGDRPRARRVRRRRAGQPAGRGRRRGPDRDAGARSPRRRRRRPAPARQPVPVRRAADRRGRRDGVGCRDAAGSFRGRRARAAASGSRRAWPGRWPRCPTAAA